MAEDFMRRTALHSRFQFAFYVVFFFGKGIFVIASGSNIKSAQSTMLPEGQQRVLEWCSSFLHSFLLVSGEQGAFWQISYLECLTLQLWSYCIFCIFNIIILILLKIITCYEGFFRNACLTVIFTRIVCTYLEHLKFFFTAKKGTNKNPSCWAQWEYQLFLWLVYMYYCIYII